MAHSRATLVTNMSHHPKGIPNIPTQNQKGLNAMTDNTKVSLTLALVPVAVALIALSAWLATIAAYAAVIATAL